MHHVLIRGINKRNWSFAKSANMHAHSSSKMGNIGVSGPGKFLKVLFVNDTYVVVLTNISLGYIATNGPRKERTLLILRCTLKNRFLLQILEAAMFMGLRQLQVLKLGDNKISYMDLNAFQGLNVLKDLQLGQNDIRDLQPRTFKRLKKLKRLDLRTNAIPAVFPIMFSGNMHRLNEIESVWGVVIRAQIQYKDVLPV